MCLIPNRTEAKILLMAASIWNSVAPESMLPLTMYAIDWGDESKSGVFVLRGGEMGVW